MQQFLSVYFLYFVQVLFLSRFTSRTPKTNGHNSSSTFYSCKFDNLETLKSSMVAAFPHASYTRFEIVHCKKNWYSCITIVNRFTTW